MCPIDFVSLVFKRNQHSTVPSEFTFVFVDRFTGIFSYYASVRSESSLLRIEFPQAKI